MTTELEKQRKRLQRFTRFYPPFLGAGVKVESISEDFRTSSGMRPRISPTARSGRLGG
jgi:hypothetical protein